jgi:EthD domain
VGPLGSLVPAAARGRSKLIKLFVFLQLSGGEPWDAWRALELPVGVRRYVLNRAIPGASVPELVFSDFDGAAELWLDELEPPLAERVKALEEQTAERSIRLVCRESVQFDRGFGEAKFIGLSRRHPSFDHESWIRYWVDVHGPLAHGVPEFTRYYGKYAHNYVVPHELASGGPEDFDGIVEEWLEGAAAMAACLAEPKYLEIVRPDELKFVDFERSHMLLTEEETIFDRDRVPG